jgi:DNA-directed RNA polymerase specialized sigma24 family protein
LVELQAIYRLVDELPATTRVAFVLRRVEGMGLEEIAEMMKLSLATVKRRIQEAERLLSFAYPTLGKPSPEAKGPEGSLATPQRGYD